MRCEMLRDGRVPTLTPHVVGRVVDGDDDLRSRNRPCLTCGSGSYGRNDRWPPSMRCALPPPRRFRYALGDRLLLAHPQKDVVDAIEFTHRRSTAAYRHGGIPNQESDIWGVNILETDGKHLPNRIIRGSDEQAGGERFHPLTVLSLPDFKLIPADLAAAKEKYGSFGRPEVQPPSAPSQWKDKQRHHQHEPWKFLVSNHIDAVRLWCYARSSEESNDSSPADDAGVGISFTGHGAVCGHAAYRWSPSRRARHGVGSSVPTAKSRYSRGEGFCAPARRERGAYPQRSVTSEQNRGHAKELPPRGQHTRSASKPPGVETGC